MKLGRNKPCHCGSGNKYKKCCWNNDQMKSHQESQFINKLKDKSHLVELYQMSEKGNDEFLEEVNSSFDSLKKYTFNFDNNQIRSGNKVDYIRRFKKLPKDLRDNLKLLLQHIPIMDGSCYYNSLYLSTLIDGVEKVDGWYGLKSDKVDVIEKDEDLGGGFYTCHFKKEKMDRGMEVSNEIFQSGNHVEGCMVYDENEDTIYYKHSWNKFNDIHFDVTWGTIDWGLLQQQGWREYIELPNRPKPTKELNKKIITMLDCKSWLEGCKNWVLNRGVLNNWVFDKVGGEEGYVTDFVIPFDETEIKEHQMKVLQMGGV